MVTVRLKVRFTEDQLVESGKYDLKAVVVEYVNIEQAIFVFQRTLQEEDVFQTIAKPVHMEKYPATTPTHLGSFFRKTEAYLVFDTLEDREEAREIFESRIQTLVTEWEQLYPYIESEEEVEFTAT